MQWFKQECELAGAIYGASIRLQIASCVWLFMTAMVFVLGSFIPSGGEEGPTAMLKPMFDMARSLVPWVGLLVFLTSGASVAEIYVRERRRLLYL